MKPTGRGSAQPPTHLPDDHEQVDAGHSLQRGLWVQPADVRPAGRRELQHGSFDLARGGVDVPAGNTHTGAGLQRPEERPTQGIVVVQGGGGS